MVELETNLSCLFNDLRSQDIDACAVIEFKMNGPRAFSPLLNGYQEFISLIRGGEAEGWWSYSGKTWTCR